jgi:hypothetical protein
MIVSAYGTSWKQPAQPPDTRVERALAFDV